MDDHHNPNPNHHHHHHELPPLPTAAVTTPTILHSPPQNSCYLPPILSQTCLGSFSSSAPQSFFSSHEPQLLTPGHFPHSPTFLSYGFDDPNIHSVFPKDDGKKALDAWSTKVARTNRRLARQRTITSSFTTRTSSSSSCGYNDDYSKGLTVTHFPNTDSSHNNRNLFTFCTPDNKVYDV